MLCGKLDCSCRESEACFCCVTQVECFLLSKEKRVDKRETDTIRKRMPKILYEDLPTGVYKDMQFCVNMDTGCHWKPKRVGAE